jgi:hypothetical protein
MSDDSTDAQQLLTDAVNANQQDTAPKPTDTTPKAATATPWDDLGSFDDVKKRLEHSRTWEKRAKENADAAKKLADIEEASKTEAQKLQDRLAAAETELTEHRVRDIRARAAREAGLDTDMAEFLTASEPDTALAQAKALAKRVQPAKPDLRQGARTATQTKEDPNAWLRRAAGYTTP